MALVKVMKWTCCHRITSWSNSSERCFTLRTNLTRDHFYGINSHPVWNKEKIHKVFNIIGYHIRSSWANIININVKVSWSILKYSLKLFPLLLLHAGPTHPPPSFFPKRDRERGKEEQCVLKQSDANSFRQ